MKIIEEEPGGTRHLFRGQGDADWKLVPGLYRREHVPVHAETLEEAFGYFEQMGIEGFFSEGIPYLPSLPRGFAHDRILAQHFGVPTRLLDWSTDPLVAAFFAVENWKTDTDAAIFMLLPDATFRPNGIQQAGYNTVQLIPPAIDRRIPSQKSTFTIHPYGPPNDAFQPLDERSSMGNSITTKDNEITRGFAKITIPKDRKKYLLQSLVRMGVDRRNLFPGLDGVGSDIALRMQIGGLHP